MRADHAADRGGGQAFRAEVDVARSARTRAGNALLVERAQSTAPMLDDLALKSLTPTRSRPFRRILSDAAEPNCAASKASTSPIGGAARGSAHRLVDPRRNRLDDFPNRVPDAARNRSNPGLAERLAAEASGSRLRARQIELGADEDPFEFMFERGLTDGLPVVPPTPERVMRMLAGTRRDPQEVIATVPPNLAPLTIEKVAANAVMAGCRPEYLPVVIAVARSGLHRRVQYSWRDGDDGRRRHRSSWSTARSAIGSA